MMQDLAGEQSTGKAELQEVALLEEEVSAAVSLAGESATAARMRALFRETITVGARQKRSVAIAFAVERWMRPS